MRPGYAEDLNNIAAGHQALHQWDEAIAAARDAIRLRPDFQLARNNRAWSRQQRLVNVTSRYVIGTCAALSCYSFREIQSG